MTILQKITVPHESVNDQYLTVITLCFKSGDIVKKNDIILELETSKTLLTVEAQADGFISYFCDKGDEVAVNDLIAQITDEPYLHEELLVTTHENDKKSEIKSEKRTDVETIFSIKAMEIIAKEGIKKELFNEFDFVTETVVLDYLNPGRQRQKEKNEIASQHSPKGSARNDIFQNDEKISITKLSNAKKREIEYLSSVQEAGLVSTIYIDVNLGSFFELVNPQLEYFKESILPVVIYESSRLLLKYPLLNAFYANGEIAVYNNVNIGVAIDIDDGLKVVKIHSTNDLGLNSIENKLMELVEKYQDRKLETVDLIDVTFTITDLSSNGAYFFTPLINKNNSAILGIANSNDHTNNVILSLSFDHRVTEGKVATNFLFELKERLISYSLHKRDHDIRKVVCYKCMKPLNDDLGEIGFIKVVNAQGLDKFICDTCLFYH